ALAQEAQLLPLPRPEIRRRVEPGALLRERPDHHEPQRLRKLPQLRQRRLELHVAHAGQLHRRHDGARRTLAGFFQLDSIGTDHALGSSSPPRIFMNVDLPQPFAPFPPPNFTETSEKRSLAPK